MIETNNRTEKNETPLMRQYWEMKSAHQDKILFFRMGDFFELFFDDAVTAAPLIGITLTRRNKKSQDETPMCGLPHHAVANPINKLLSLGFKVAICDQIEDPKFAKGIVKRGITRVLTPGMVYDTDTLDATQSHYMASIDKTSVSFVDPSTGESFYYLSRDFTSLRKLIEILPTVELVVSREDFEFTKSYWTKTLSAFDELKEDETLPRSAQRLQGYILSLGGNESLSMIKPFENRELVTRLDLSPTVLRHLEVFNTYKGETQGSLFAAINRTQTSQGARLLRQYIAFPLRSLSQIKSRLDQIEEWTKDLGQVKQIRQVLALTGDIERRLQKLTTPQCHARDILGLAESTMAAQQALLLANKNDDHTAQLESLSQEVLATFREDAPLSTKQGHMIKQGVHQELDELIRLSQDSQSLLAEMEAREKEKTGISSLKIRYNNVFGYYIEITHTHKDKVPASYQRKQTLANAERYCTDELIELEKKVLSAQSRRQDLEYALFEALRKKLFSFSQNFLQLAHRVAELDVTIAGAWLALERKMVRPSFHQDMSTLDLRACRHPVVEQSTSTPFIANNIQIKPHHCMLLTGPNMAGKSTLMRQIAVVVIMAQMGYYVPCESASLPVFDRIFTRIGASDQLTEGLSTFMVEMKETAELMKECTSESLVILDEVGRGTSTFDGLSLAQAILEFLVADKKPMTLFATHYHELTTLENSSPVIKNYHMAVIDSTEGVQFTHSLVKGPALKSYGIYVADLAGIPKIVTRRAKGILKGLESQKVSMSPQLSLLDMELD
jgi:DNA mismatch repair protein MutS